MCQREDEDGLTRAILQLASAYGRYGYRRITALLRTAGWAVGKDRVQRIWRREGLKIPQKQRPRGRLWLNDGSCVRLRPERENHVWAYDFVRASTHDGRTLRLLTLIDEYTRKCLAIRVARRLNSYDLIEILADLMLRHGVPEHIRSDNGPEFIALRLPRILLDGFYWLPMRLRSFSAASPGSLVAKSDVTGEFCTRGNVRETGTRGAEA